MAQRTVKPTLLGRILRYWNDSRSYAFGDNTKASSRKFQFNDVLSQMANTPVQTDGDAALAEMSRMAIVSSWVYSDLKLLSDRASSYEWFTVEQQLNDEEFEVIKDHPLLQLFRKPNPIMSGSFLKRYIINWFVLYGNAYLYFVADKTGIKEVWPLPSNMVQPDPTTLRKSTIDDRMILDFIYTVNGKQFKLSGEYVIHFRTVNIFDYWLGLSPLSALQLPIRTDFSQSLWLDTFFGKENAIPAAIVSLPEELGDAEFETVRNDLMEQFGGGRKTAVTRAGDISIEIIQQAISELRVLEGREFNRQEIDRIFGVPEGMITGGLSGDSRLAAEISFARNALQPIIDIFVDDLNRSFSPFIRMGVATTEKFVMSQDEKDKKGADEKDGEIVYVLRAADIVPQDQALEIADYSAYMGDRTLNENRRLHDDDPLELTGDLAELQPLIDKVPQSLVALVAPVFIQKWQVKFAPQPEVQNPFASLFGGNAKPSPFGEESGENGEPAPDEEIDKADEKDGKETDAGYRNTGQESPQVVQEQMASKATPLEIATLQKLIAMSNGSAINLKVGNDNE